MSTKKDSPAKGLTPPQDDPADLDLKPTVSEDVTGVPGAASGASSIAPTQDDPADQDLKLTAAAEALAGESLDLTFPSPSVLPELVTVTALHPIRHNGKDYGPGCPDGLTVKVTQAEREQLLDAGAITAD
jgi:hypothetical protein